MTALYNFSIFSLAILARLASFVHPKAKAFVTGRKNLFKNLSNRFHENKRPVVWVHCASLGEFEQGRPIIESIRRDLPDYFVLLTFFSPSGYEVRKNYAEADYVTYLPLDTAANAKKFIGISKPALAIFVKYEFWHHYAKELKARNTPLISVSAIFRKDQFFFSSAGSFYRNILRSFSYFFVQNTESLKLLNSIGISNVTVGGDTRFDRVYEVVNRNEEVEIARRFKNDQKVMVVGSSWNDDIDVLSPFFNENTIKFIVAPHEISESTLGYVERSLQVKSIRFSKASEVKDLESYSVLIIDNVGLLSRLYRYGEFAYIGGAFGKGLHNILEAACYGVPIFFGEKNYEKFQEAVDLINRGGAFEIRDYTDLKAKYEMLNVPSSFLLACEVTRQYVEENLGATKKIMTYCKDVLNKKP